MSLRTRKALRKTFDGGVFELVDETGAVIFSISQNAAGETVLIVSGLPTVDPAVEGQVYLSTGDWTVSAGA